MPRVTVIIFSLCQEFRMPGSCQYTATGRIVSSRAGL
jgi:hypothetical protein